MLVGILLSLLMSSDNMHPVIDLPNGSGPREVFIHQAGGDNRDSDDMSYGPQEYIVDGNECIYVHDINEQTNRVMKFDSTGMLLFVIDSLAIPALRRVWFGPMTSDLSTNDLIIAGSGLPGDAGESPGLVPTSEIPSCMFRFSELGQLLKVVKIPAIHASFLLSSYDGRFYTKHVDGGGEFNENLGFVRAIPKPFSVGHGYSQWTYWTAEGVDLNKEYKQSDQRAGKFLIKLRNVTTRQLMRITFCDPPRYSWGGFIEGEDRHGNLYVKAGGSFVRVNPKTKKVAIVHLSKLGIPSGSGDVRHASFVSPNGNVYWAALIRSADGGLRYHIYRIQSGLFEDKISEVEMGRH